MTLVDSSVSIEYFRGTISRQTEKLDRLLSSEQLASGDLMLTEVSQGFADERGFVAAEKVLSALIVVGLGGEDLAIQAARNYRLLRKGGTTVRKTIDSIIATRCIQDNYQLLHDDRDFDAYAEHLGLRSVL